MIKSILKYLSLVKSLRMCVHVCVCVSRSVMSDSLQLIDLSPPGSSVHGILQARIPEWVASHYLLQGIFLTQD